MIPAPCRSMTETTNQTTRTSEQFPLIWDGPRYQLLCGPLGRAITFEKECDAFNAGRCCETLKKGGKSRVQHLVGGACDAVRYISYSAWYLLGIPCAATCCSDIYLNDDQEPVETSVKIKKMLQYSGVSCCYSLATAARTPFNFIAPEVLSTVCRQHECDLCFTEMLFKLHYGHAATDSDRYEQLQNHDWSVESFCCG